MPPDMKPDGIAILDFGGQYCHLIARRIREMNVYSEILPSDSSPKEIADTRDAMVVRGIILSGSPGSVGGKVIPFDTRVLEMDLPVLGLCYGHQLIAAIFGGDVRSGELKEYGSTEAFIDMPVGLLDGMEPLEKVWMSHGDTVFGLGSDFDVLAHTAGSPVAAYKHKNRRLWGLQWHPEVVHTEKGGTILGNFVFGICGCKSNWVPSDQLRDSVKEIIDIVGNGKAIIALSGGVDSSVAGAIAGKALGTRLLAVHVDNGLMRLNESKAVLDTFKNFGLELVFVDARRRFIDKLRGVTDPESKRKIIGEEFIRVFEEEARGFGAEYLIQGTIYPDRIESGITRHSDTIKTHHNVGGLPLNIEFKEIIEPLKNLYKDEVRGLGLSLGLSKEIVQRQPFPGPGLAVRIIGEVTEEALKILRIVDGIVCSEVEASEHFGNVWQYFAILTNLKTTGVKGDERAYGYTVAVRFVESLDGMTASFSKAPWPLIERISNRIVNEVPSVTRVVYDVTHKPPATIEWE
jgi:GMP synthase (glutamine-hydrolysing)